MSFSPAGLSITLKALPFWLTNLQAKRFLSHKKCLHSVQIQLFTDGSQPDK